jgi:hypothetical protein
MRLTRARAGGTVGADAAAGAQTSAEVHATIRAEVRAKGGWVGFALSACWLATGLWVLADGAHLERLGSRRLAAALLGSGWLARWAWLVRCGAGALLLVAALSLARLDGCALGVVALLLALSAVLSVAVLAFPLRPRLYAASVVLSGVLALGCSLGY